MNIFELESGEQVRDLISWHNENSKYLVLDVETTSENPREASLIDVQFQGQDVDDVVIFDGKFASELLRLKKDIALVGHNVKYDLHVLHRHGVSLLDHAFRDTILMSHLCDENRESYALSSYTKEYWNTDYKDAFWAKYKAVGYAGAPKAERQEYACLDIYYTRQLYVRLHALLNSERIPAALVSDVHELQRYLLKTEIQGLRVDVEYLTEVGKRLRAEVDQLLPEMRSQCPLDISLVEMQLWEKEIEKYKTEARKALVPKPELSFDSPKQLQKLLFEQLGLPKQFSEKSKKPSVDDACLEKLKEAHPIVPLIQKYRGVHKVIGTYIEGTLDRMRGERIYPEFRVSGTVTGRISHSNPNLGQLPKTGGVRGIYVPDPGRVFISADFSQLEVCIEANLTGCSSLKRILIEGLSKHDLTASELGVERHAAKTLNFALQYFASHYKVAKLLGISPEEGLKVWEKYWNVYSGAKALKAKTDSMVNRGQPIVSLFGRKRRFERKRRNPWDSDYRQAYNFLIQGTGADITSIAFHRISRWLEANGYGRGLFTLHDEIIIEVLEEHAAASERELVRVMTEVGREIGFKIPLQAESSGITRRWEDK